ncbi:SRPBCC family protein [Roseomonas sp. CAU 1739]|uniref:SRPBCC family protein n=1 Tax=Roseomonas sp. CAU 1739 TaxID=3140364 RepID=UPI00325B65A2
MNDLSPMDAYGVLSKPATLTIKRLLPGPIERIWAYITDSDLRRQWLASGPMEAVVGAPVEFVWRNDELTDPPGQRPEGFSAEHRLVCTITDIDPPRRLSITWGSTGGVTFELEPAGAKVLLTVTHRRVADRAMLLNVSAGWHMHLDVLAARASGMQPQPYWDGWVRLRRIYEQRIPD